MVDLTMMNHRNWKRRIDTILFDAMESYGAFEKRPRLWMEKFPRRIFISWVRNDLTKRDEIL